MTGILNFHSEQKQTKILTVTRSFRNMKDCFNEVESLESHPWMTWEATNWSEIITGEKLDFFRPVKIVMYGWAINVKVLIQLNQKTYDTASKTFEINCLTFYYDSQLLTFWQVWFHCLLTGQTFCFIGSFKPIKFFVILTVDPWLYDSRDLS